MGSVCFQSKSEGHQTQSWESHCQKNTVKTVSKSRSASKDDQAKEAGKDEKNIPGRGKKEIMKTQTRKQRPNNSKKLELKYQLKRE